jgi:hypothetical protein
MLTLCDVGVYRELTVDCVKPREEQWFRDIWISLTDPSHYIIIACSTDMANVFHTCAHVQIDFSYKLIYSDYNVFSVVGYNTFTKSNKLCISLIYTLHILTTFRNYPIVLCL